MRIIRAIGEIIALYIIYLAGVWVQNAFQLFIPGSMIGMIFLLILLQLKIVKLEWIEQGSILLIKYLPLLFLPVTVAIITYGELFTLKGILIVLCLMISTALVMISTGFISQALMVKRRYENE